MSDESITKEFPSQSTHFLVPNMLKLAKIAKFCKKLYENWYQLYECVWMSQKGYVKVFQMNFTAHVYTFRYQKCWN